MSNRRRFNVDDLFTDTRPRAAGVSDLLDAKEIQLDRIEPDPDQPRNSFDQAGLEELAASIRAEGILQPISVRYDDDRDVYVIVHGERRWRAAQMAGLDAIPAIVRDVSGNRVLLQQLMENIVREDLNALDRAVALRTLKEQMDDAPWDQVAEAVGIRRSRLFQLLGTEKLSDGFRDLLRQGVVSEKQTRGVQRLSEEIQEELASRLQSGALDATDLDVAARAVRDATTVEEARARLDLAAATTEDEQARRLTRTARRQVRSLQATLDEIDANGITVPDIQDDLQALARTLERVLR